MIAMKIKSVLFLSAAVSLFCSGCGYTTRGFLGSYKSIYIKPVVNKIRVTGETQEYGKYRSIPPLTENKFTRALRDRFNLDGSLQMRNQQKADLVLECSMNDYIREVLRYNDNEGVDEYRIKLQFSYKLYRGNNEELLRTRNLVADTEYTLSGSRAETEDSALDDLLDDAARRVVGDVIEWW